MLLGTIETKKIKDDTLIYTKATDDRIKHRKQFTDTPHWFYSRSIMAHLKNGKIQSSSLMSPDLGNETKQVVNLTKQELSNRKIINSINLNGKKKASPSFFINDRPKGK